MIVYDNLIYAREYVLHRNYSQLLFNGNSNSSTASKVFENVKNNISNQFIELDINNPEDKNIIKLYSLDFYNDIVESKNENLKIYFFDKFMVALNQYDHIEIHYFTYDNTIEQKYIISNLVSISNQICGDYVYAKDDNGNYINSNPTLCGTGLRLYTYCHLPTLSLRNKTDFQELKDNKLTLFTQQNPNSNPICAMSVLSNISCDYKDIDIQLEKYNKCLENLLNQEVNEQNKIISSDIEYIRDKINKSYGIAKYSHLLYDYEFVFLFSFYRTGIEMNLIDMSIHSIDHLFRNIYKNTLNIEPVTELYRVRAQQVKELFLPLINKIMED